MGFGGRWQGGQDRRDRQGSKTVLPVLAIPPVLPAWRMATLEEQTAQRRSNLDELTKLGVDVYPRRFARTHSIAQLVAGYGERTREELEANRIQTTTSGRL